MPKWRVHDDRNFNIFSMFDNDVFKSESEGATGFPCIGKLAKNYSGGAIKNTEPFQVQKHAVDVAEFLVAVFEKQNCVFVKFCR